MTSVTDSLRRRIRRLLAPLSATPFHPQWLVNRQHSGRTEWVAGRACGEVLDVGCAQSEIRKALHQTTSYIGLDYF